MNKENDSAGGRSTCNRWWDPHGNPVPLGTAIWWMRLTPTSDSCFAREVVHG